MKSIASKDLLITITRRKTLPNARVTFLKVRPLAPCLPELDIDVFDDSIGDLDRSYSGRWYRAAAGLVVFKTQEAI